MTLQPVNTICVCGAGTMGSGILQLAAQAGYNAVLFDVNKTMLDKGISNITSGLDKLFEKGKLDISEKDIILSRVKFTSDINACIADVIIEAIVEDKAAKIELLNNLSAINSGHTILATNTSSISVSEIAAGVNCPSRVIGMHFFNPAPLMKLVEVIKADKTADDVIAAIIAVANKMGKTPVICRDSPGFIVNRVARHYYLEAMKLVEEGLADITTVDAIMEASGFKMGPFRLMDLIGIDVNYSVSNIVWRDLGEPERLKPSRLQKAKVDDGDLGRKTGRGFYDYRKP